MHCFPLSRYPLICVRLLMCSLNLPQASPKLLSVNAAQIIIRNIHPLCILFPTKTWKPQHDFFYYFLFFQFSLSLSLFRWRLHGGQVPFIKRQGVIFSLGNVYVPSTAPNWENRLPLRKPSVSAPCELSGWFLHFMRHLNPPVISPVHLSACYKNCSEGSAHPFRQVRAWFPNVVLGLHCKKPNPTLKNPSYCALTGICTD